MVADPKPGGGLVGFALIASRWAGSMLLLCMGSSCSLRFRCRTAKSVSIAARLRRGEMMEDEGRTTYFRTALGISRRGASRQDRTRPRDEKHERLLATHITWNSLGTSKPRTI